MTNEGLGEGTTIIANITAKLRFIHTYIDQLMRLPYHTRVL